MNTLRHLHLPTLDELRAERSRSAKWSAVDEGVIPVSIADMDFPIAAPIRERLVEFHARGDMTYIGQGWHVAAREMAASRMAERYHWEVSPNQVATIGDVVQALHMMTVQLTRPGEGIGLPTPIYPPFYGAVEEHGRRVVAIPMRQMRDRWELDLEALQEHARQGSFRVLYLCHPHNPTGSVFRSAELEEIANVVLAEDLIVVSDEIHAELIHGKRTHIPFASLGAEVADRTVTLTSATKAFNIAGTRLAFIIYGSRRLQRRLPDPTSHLWGRPSAAGFVATEAAWGSANEWLDEVRAYLRANRDHLFERLASEVPTVAGSPPEATYLAWLDFSRHYREEASDALVRDARVQLSPGSAFGHGFSTFARLNFANPRGILDEAIDRIMTALGTPSASTGGWDPVPRREAGRRGHALTTISDEKE